MLVSSGRRRAGPAGERDDLGLQCRPPLPAGSQYFEIVFPLFEPRAYVYRGATRARSMARLRSTQLLDSGTTVRRTFAVVPIHSEVFRFAFVPR